MKLAAIDIGSNSIKLIVVDAAASDSFTVLAREKETVRLGHDTLRDEHLSPAAIERAADCIKRLGTIAEARGAERLIVIATASVREATNAAEFVDEVERRTGLRVEVLSGVEEARLIGMAVAQGCAGESVTLVNIDIGGGSTEISLVRDREPAKLYSVKLGAVGLTERFIANDPPEPAEIRALREEIRAALEQPSRELHGTRWQLATGTSGTIIAIGAILRQQQRTLREPCMEETGAPLAGTGIALDPLARFNEQLSAMTFAERRGISGISAQRAEILVAGGQILEGAMRAFGIDSLRICDSALREGVIIDRLREWEEEKSVGIRTLAADYSVS